MTSGNAAMSALAWGNAPGNLMFCIAIILGRCPRLGREYRAFGAKHDVSSVAKVYDRMANTPRWNHAFRIGRAPLPVSIYPRIFVRQSALLAL